MTDTTKLVPGSKVMSGDGREAWYCGPSENHGWSWVKFDGKVPIEWLTNVIKPWSAQTYAQKREALARDIEHPRAGLSDSWRRSVAERIRQLEQDKPDAEYTLIGTVNHSHNLKLPKNWAAVRSPAEDINLKDQTPIYIKSATR